MLIRGAQGSVGLVRSQQVTQIRRCKAMDGTEDKQQDFELNSELNREPVERVQHRGDVVVFAGVGEETSGCILHKL